MYYFILLVAILFLALGLIGSFIPGLPGPPLSYLGLLMVEFIDENQDWNAVIWIGVVVLVVTVLDYYLQIYGVKKSGGGKYAIRGSVIGMLLGIFLFPPFGILAGAFIGAYVGAKMETDKNEVKIAFGALWGFIAGTVLKLCTSSYIIYFLICG